MALNVVIVVVVVVVVVAKNKKKYHSNFEMQFLQNTRTSRLFFLQSWSLEHWNFSVVRVKLLLLAEIL